MADMNSDSSFDITYFVLMESFELGKVWGFTVVSDVQSASR